MDRKLKKKRFTPKRIIYFSVTTLFFGTIFYYLIFGDKSTKFNVNFERLTISEVTRGDFIEYVTVTCTVIPIQTVVLTAIEGGRVEKKFVEAGTIVEKGDPILLLENTSLMLDIMQRQADFVQQENRVRQTKISIDQKTLGIRQTLIEMNHQLRQTKRILEREEELYKKNATSRQKYEDAKYNYEYFSKRRELAIQSHIVDSLYREQDLKLMEQSLITMRTNMEFASKKLENLTLRAAVSGHLTLLDAELGESKNKGQTLGQIDILDGFKLLCRMDEHYVPRIFHGLTGKLMLQNTNEEYNCTVSKIFPTVVGNQFRIDLTFLDREPPGIKNGQTIRVRLELGDPIEAIMIPKGGFFSTTGGQWIYVVDKSGDFTTKRKIKIGRNNSLMYEIYEGLEPGEKVITSSYDNFGDPDKLIIKR